MTQAGDEERRPVRMIANLNSDNVARPERFQLMREKLRTLFDSGKGVCNLATGVENRGAIAIFLQ